MDRSVTIHVLDQTTGERLTPAGVMLDRIGVPGRTRAESNEDGSFSFTQLSQIAYSLAVYDPQYAPHHERFGLTPENSKVLELHLTPGGFLSGQALDEVGQPPERCWFTLLRSGERRGRSGYISDSGDHKVSADGKFCSPPLYPARYFLRVAGLLREPHAVLGDVDRDDRYSRECHNDQDDRGAIQRWECVSRGLQRRESGSD